MCYENDLSNGIPLEIEPDDEITQPEDPVSMEDLITQPIRRIQRLRTEPGMGKQRRPGRGRSE